jgi:hypothetical protein
MPAHFCFLIWFCWSHLWCLHLFCLFLFKSKFKITYFRAWPLFSFLQSLIIIFILGFFPFMFLKSKVNFYEMMEFKAFLYRQRNTHTHKSCLISEIDTCTAYCKDSLMASCVFEYRIIRPEGAIFQFERTYRSIWLICTAIPEGKTSCSSCFGRTERGA